MSLKGDSRELPLLEAGHKGSCPGTPINERIAIRNAAFRNADVLKSREVHQRMLGTGVPTDAKAHLQRNAASSSEYLRAVVFGGLDGIATIFATVAGCVGAQLSPVQTLIVGSGNLLANAMSMGFGEYLSSTAEDEFIDGEREREEWEVDNCPEEEQREMIEIYQHRYGFTYEDARNVIETSFKYKEFFISHMMAEELGLLLPGGESEDSPTAAKRGLVMFASFLLFGLVPLASVLLRLSGIGYLADPLISFIITAAASCITLFILGALKAWCVARQKITEGGFTMMLNGSLAGLVAYLVGYTLQRLAGATVLD